MTGTIVGIAQAVREGRMRATDVVAQAFERIALRNDDLVAFVFLDRERAMRAAEEIDAVVRLGRPVGSLAGVPFGVKDMEDCVGMPTTFGSLMFKDAPPAVADSVHVARLRAAGAIPIGKTAAAEFGIDSATNTRAFGVTRNPWNRALTSGGSSGGSATAVAAGFTPFSVGSDGGGSIREPAAFSGLVGLKPSHGRIPNRDGSSMQTCLGALTTTVRDTARYLDVVAGPDARDRTSLPPPTVRYEDVLEHASVEGLRAIWSSDFGFAPVEPEVRALTQTAMEKICLVANLDLLPDTFHPTNIYLDWVHIGIDQWRTEMELAGLFPDGIALLSPTVRQALDMFPDHDRYKLHKSRQRLLTLERDVAELFMKADILITPATACAAYAADAQPPKIIDGRDASESGAEPFGMFANICWNPSISIPAGFTKDGRPVGVQITARRHREDILLRIAHLYEQSFPWPRTAP